MAEKILVADDSLTIQKVIAITLANTDYELVECLSHKELVSQLESDTFKLVLLDFNLSDSKSGYELGQEIKKLSSDVSVLAMLGTFDTVDDQQLSDSGIEDKIVKPFESEKFIQKCRALIENSDATLEDDFAEVEIQQDFGNDEIEEEQEIGSDWVVDSPKPDDISSSSLEEVDQKPTSAEFDTDTAKNALSEEMNSWGIEVPDVIGEEKKFGIFPPKIESDNVEQSLEENLPDESDLVYPEFGTSEFEELDLDDDEDLDATDPSFQMPTDFNESTENVLSIEEEIDGDEFWAVDEDGESDSSNVVSIEDVTQLSPSENISDIDDLDDLEEEEVDQIFSDLENEIDSEKESYHVAETKNIPIEKLDFDSDEIVAQVKESLTPILEELVKKFCKDKIEQVAWEVIPDLAENLIKKEIKDISDSLES
ncbi:response regulator [Halobacteriovorax sp. HLS]|uniref:response regulator n=1 Tax=Halobacteriovorax sp. HLS TaxID=2234000 RepID=UPI000FDA0DF7|nr:response regulator [Halobacteriovorax sp. HLS]